MQGKRAYFYICDHHLATYNYGPNEFVLLVVLLAPLGKLEHGVELRATVLQILCSLEQPPNRNALETKIRALVLQHPQPLFVNLGTDPILQFFAHVV